MSLKSMHRRLIEQAQDPMNLGRRLPVTPSEPETPVIAVERWNITRHSLTKRYEFRRPADRPRFVTALLEYEEETQHHATLILSEGAVIVKLVTKDVDRVTELDKEYARFADVVFKDLAHAPDTLCGVPSLYEQR